MKYDPHHDPNPRFWLALEEAERVFIVQKFHTEADIRNTNPVLHAMFHVIVEDQVALGDDFIAKATLERLIAEGLDRHEGIHAMGSVVVGHVHKTATEKETPANAAAAYQQRLNGLTASAWKKQMK